MAMKNLPFLTLVAMATALFIPIWISLALERIIKTSIVIQ
jgi:hypothetical protein